MTLPGDPREQRAFLRHPLVDMLIIAAPSVVQMTSHTLMQFVDSWMVALWGKDPIYVSAQGNGGFSVWVPMSIIFGMAGVVNSFVSQNLGAGTPAKGARYAWAQFWISVVAAALMLPLIWLYPRMFEAFGHSEELIRHETQYATILLAGAVLPMASKGVANYFFGMHRPVIPMTAALLGNAANILANFVLIFGFEPLGIPEMGLVGAAIGTVIGSAVELVLPAVVFLGPRWARSFATRASWRPRIKPIGELLRVGTPAGLMFVNEMVCFGYLLVVLGGRFGEAQQAAGHIALRYMSLSFMPTVGLSIAVTAIVGRLIGMGRLDLAEKRAWLGTGLAVAYMGGCAACFVIFREQLIGLFVPEGTPAEEAAELLQTGALILIAAAVFQVFDAVAVTISGALRAAGDTLVPSILTITLSWALIVGGGHLAIELKPEWGVLGPWIGASAYIVVLGLALLVRFRMGAWKRMRLAEAPPPDADPRANGPTPDKARPPADA
ncbi:MAG: MATE family efflux transporter [Planctomycetota bacterium]